MLRAERDARAEVLLYTLVPEMLAGRNHLPSAAAQALMPAAYRPPTPIVNLPDRDDPRYDAELLALNVDLYIDYGTVDDDYVSALKAITGRRGIPGIILDGALTNVASVYRLSALLSTFLSAASVSLRKRSGSSTRTEGRSLTHPFACTSHVPRMA